MCSSKTRLNQSVDLSPAVADINDRPVLQPTSNRVRTLEKRHSLKKKTPSPITTKPISPLSSPSGANRKKTTISVTPPISPNSKTPRSPEPKKPGVDQTGGNRMSSEKVLTPRRMAKTASSPKKLQNMVMDNPALNFSSSLMLESPGSIAAARKEQVAMMQEQRKMKIAHYGRTKSARIEGKVVPLDSVPAPPEEKRCTFITSNSDPIFVAYHDEEWGVPVHDDK